MSAVPAFDLDRDPRDQEHVDTAPASIEAEQALLGCVIFDNAAYERVVTGLKPQHFYEPFHARLWAAIEEHLRKGQLAEPIVLMERFKRDPAFEELGGLRYLAELVDHAPPAASAPEYARVIADAAMRRQIIAMAGELIEEAKDDSDRPAFDVLASFEQRASEIANGSVSGSAWVKAGEVTRTALAEARERKGMVGLSTGLQDLDQAIGGLRKGQMIVVAGRPAMGKSTAGLQIAKAVARKGRGVIFFSLEMPPFDLGLRMACDVAHEPLAPMFSGVSSNPRYFDAANGKLDDSQWWALEQAREEIEAWPLVFDVRAGLTVPVMAALARRQIRAWERVGIEPGAIVVDHLTIAKADQDRRGNKVAEVGDISRGLAETAKSLDMPLVALCQLSRDVEKRGTTDRRPGLADLRWSGEIEQDARVVAFLYRPEYYNRPPEDPADDVGFAEYQAKKEKYANQLFWLIEKNNNGPTTQVETYCNIACSAIRDKLGGYSR